MSTFIEFYSSSYEEKELNEEWMNGKINENINYSINSSSFEEEPPLLEELGIDIYFIKQKTLTILFPKKNIDFKILQDTDLGGPFIYCILLGFCLLLQSGKLHFGYIFGYTILGSIILCWLLNLMSEHESGISISHTLSILGYCLAPMNLLALFSIIFPPTGVIGFLFSCFIIFYCTYSASIVFVKVLNTTDQKYLFAYPIALLYICFALIVIF